MESSAILVFVQEHYDKDNIFGFENFSEQSQALQWLFFWQAAAPVQGQLMRMSDLKEPHACKYTLRQLTRLLSIKPIACLICSLKHRRDKPLQNTNTAYLFGT
jgi:glutathione S-transferase